MQPTDGKIPQRDELKWVNISELNPTQKNSKGLGNYLVPFGCAVTFGVLATGIYNLIKRDSRKQQLCMRYRVLAQGVTIALALLTMLDTRKESGPKPEH